MSLLEVKNLSLTFDTRQGKLTALDRVSFSISEGETLGIVGESGCGKSITSLALMGLLPPNAHVSADCLRFAGKDLMGLSESQKRKIRGREMAMIFQDPMSSLNPSFTVGYQMMEILEIHEGGSRDQRRQKSVELLASVGIPEAASRMEAFPHHLSGGMSQRVMIAMAIACRPKLLIADEPTTALDVTIQKQILDLLKAIQKKEKMALMFITHDIGVVSETSDRVLVMYAGQVIEQGAVREVIDAPRHPYTHGLLSCLPGAHGDGDHRKPLPSIPGLVPSLLNRPSGCQFHPRCAFRDSRCVEKAPLFEGDGHGVKCWKPLEGHGRAP